VIAEGVETAAQLELLRMQGCNEVQGYLIGKPLPIEHYACVTGETGPYTAGEVGKLKSATTATV